VRSSFICATTVCTACEHAQPRWAKHSSHTASAPAHEDSPRRTVCVLPGTELAFETPIKYQTTLMFRAYTGHTVAIFRQINKGAPHIHHDALEFPDGEIVLLTRLCEEQKATVLTLPTQPKTTAEAEAQQRAAYVG
jgi:hypothetical protein